VKTRCGIAIVLVAMVAAVFASLPAAASAGTSLNSYEQQLVKYINQERTARHLAKLQVNARLVDSARAHSAEMGVLKYFDHNSPTGETWGERFVSHGYTREGYKIWKAGENIAWGSPVRWRSWTSGCIPRRTAPWSSPRTFAMSVSAP
jgi:uncharacterized protein YkwD